MGWVDLSEGQAWEFQEIKQTSVAHSGSLGMHIATLVGPNCRSVFLVGLGILATSPENIFLSGNSSLASRIGLLIYCRWRVFVLHFRGPFVTNPIIPNRRKSLRPLNFNHSLTPSWHNLHSRIMALGNCLAIKFGGFSATCRRSLGGKFKWRLLTIQEISTLLRCYGSVI